MEAGFRHDVDQIDRQQTPQPFVAEVVGGLVMQGFPCGGEKAAALYPADPW